MKDLRQGGAANNRTSGPAEAKKKKPYVKPSFEYERVFETMALACGKVRTQSNCRFSPPKS